VDERGYYNCWSWTKTDMPVLSSSVFNLVMEIQYIKVKQSLYKPGHAMRVSGS
jgi:hypothetical protein